MFASTQKQNAKLKNKIFEFALLHRSIDDDIDKDDFSDKKQGELFRKSWCGNLLFKLFVIGNYGHVIKTNFQKFIANCY